MFIVYGKTFERIVDDCVYIVIYWKRIEGRYESVCGELKNISLIQSIIIRMAIGILLGITVPQFTVFGMLGTVFVNALKAIAPLLVFFIVMSALSSA